MSARSRPRPAPVFGREGLKMTLACSLSLLLHGGVAWSVHDRLLMVPDPSSASPAPRTFRVRRAPARPAYEVGRVQAVSPPAPTAPDPNQLSQALLDSAAPMATEPAEAPEMLVAEALEPQRPDEAFVPPVAPAVGPAPELVRRLIGELVLDVPYQEIDGIDGAALEPAGLRPVPTAAQEALKAARLVPAPLPAPLSPGPPQVAADLPAPRREPMPLVEPAPLDLSMLLFRNAVRMKVPEYLDDDFDYTLYAWQSPAPRWGWQKPERLGYFRVDIRARRSLSKLRTIPRDVVFLIDTSGSVTQAWVDAVVGGVADGLNSLNPQDRFNIVMFKDSAHVFSPQGIQRVTGASLTAARQFLTGARSGGYTDVNRALSRLLVRDAADQRVYYLILISDGRPTRGVQDTRELINLITRDNDLAASIYCVGVGRQQQRELLEYLAYRNRGFCVFAGRSGEAASVIRDLTSRLRFPIVRQVTLNAGGLDLAQVFPRNIPNIHQGQTFSVYGRFDPQGPDMINMQINGLTGEREVAFTFKRSLRRARPGDEQVARGWAFWKLHHLYSEQIRRGNDPRVAREIQDLERRYKLKTVP